MIQRESACVCLYVSVCLGVTGCMSESVTECDVQVSGTVSVRVVFVGLCVPECVWDCF